MFQVTTFLISVSYPRIRNLQFLFDARGILFSRS